MSLTTQQNLFLASAAQAAVVAERAALLPAELTLAQAIFESAWGTHAPGNNLFGIKANGRSKTQLLETREWFTVEELHAFLARGEGRSASARIPLLYGTSPSGKTTLYDVKDLFAAYDSLADCFTAHSFLITEGAPYKVAWETWLVNVGTMRARDASIHDLVYGVAAHYGTDPQYGAKIWAMITEPWFASKLVAVRGIRNAT